MKKFIDFLVAGWEKRNRAQYDGYVAVVQRVAGG